MKGWEASVYWGCDHHAPSECPWCNGDEQDADEAEYMGNVVRLWTPTPRRCSGAGCAAAPRWQIGSAHLSCDDHLSTVIAAAYRAAQPVYAHTWESA